VKRPELTVSMKVCVITDTVQPMQFTNARRKCQSIEHYLVIGYGLRQNPCVGEMAERLNALVLKTSKV
jgi:hypothetical protein